MQYLVSLALLFALAFAGTSNGQFQYDSTIFSLRANSSPTANCIRNTNATNDPFQCDPSFSDVTTFTLTGVNVQTGQYAESPTVPCSLNPYGSGSSTYWCIPKSDSNYPSSDNPVLECNGAPPTIGWLQFIKTGGVYGDYIYNGDTVVLYNNLTAYYCAGDIVGCNEASVSLATSFTIIF
jgi:hypothetical protein